MKLFISYRRRDTEDFAARLADRLRLVRGITGVFFDVSSIGYGEDFLKRIRTELAQCSVAIVVIGPNWLEPRLQDPGDYVRLEVREALKEQRVLPVLAGGAAMPSADSLPDDLKPLALLNALSVRHVSFDHDVVPLIDAVLQRRPPGQVGRFLRAHPLLAAIIEAAAGGVAALVLLVLLLALFNALTHLSLDEAVGGPGMALIVTGLVVVLGAVTPWYLRRRGILR